MSSRCAQQLPPNPAEPFATNPSFVTIKPRVEESDETRGGRAGEGCEKSLERC